jgi:hypothetical protein
MQAVRLREEQLEAFRLEELVTLSEASIRKHFPLVAGRLGAAGLDSLLRRSIRKAWALGFGSTSDVLQYVQLAAAFGENFEDRPDLPWARPILEDRRPEQRGFRAVRLYENALRHLRAKERASAELRKREAR